MSVNPIVFVLKPSPELSDAQLKLAQNMIRIQRTSLLRQIESLDQMAQELRKLRPVTAVRLADDTPTPFDEEWNSEVQVPA